MEVLVQEGRPFAPSVLQRIATLRIRLFRVRAEHVATGKAQVVIVR
jgi:hypothetical protein